MLIYYGSFAYFMYIIIALIFCTGFYFLLKNRTDFVKKTVILSLMLINLMQHFMKPVLYPQYHGTGFSYLGSAYNMCAFLIILSPIVFVFGNSLWRDFIAYAGTAAGIVAISVPYWFIGQTAFQWEAYRFYLCHSLLFITSLLPCLLGIHKIKFANFYKIGFIFFFALILILFNDIIFIALGLYPQTDINDLFSSLSSLNPCWSMHPPENFEQFSKLLSALSPSAFLGNETGKPYIPILWYAIPMYILITFTTFSIGCLCDRQGFKKFFRLKAEEKTIKLKS